MKRRWNPKPRWWKPKIGELLFALHPDLGYKLALVLGWRWLRGDFVHCRQNKWRRKPGQRCFRVHFAGGRFITEYIRRDLRRARMSREERAAVRLMLEPIVADRG